MLANAQKIKENGIVVFDNVKGLPLGDEPFTSPDYVICIGHRGNMQMTYDNMPDFSAERVVAVVFPNHTLKKVSKSDDYLATLVVVDASLLNDPLLRIINQMRYRYEPHPWVDLTKKEYGIIMNLAEVMKEQSLTPSLSLPSNDNTRERINVVCLSPNATVADNDLYPASSSLLSDVKREGDLQTAAVNEPHQPSCHPDASLLQEELKEGKGTEV